jgi:hypothetical protein
MKTLAVAVLGAFAIGCGNPPPASQVPSARAALDRLHASQDCGIGITATAKIDHFGKQGRVRGDLLAIALWPARLRLDVVGPMNSGIVATLTSDSGRFSLTDLREHKFLYGPAKACNIARLTTVPMPGHVLVSLLRGEAPVLKHDDAQATVSWSKSGYYVVKIPSTRNAEEELHIAPHPSDFGRPWQEQRMRLVDVQVKQEGIVLYHAELDEHQPAAMSKPRVDPDGIDPPVQPSGPVCAAELPRKIHVEVPNKDEDVQFRYDDVSWNPPVIDGLFTQPVPNGLEVVRVTCED